MTKSQLTTLMDLHRFYRNRDGGITVMNIFIIMVVAIFGGIAVDMSHLVQARTQLQIAADSAAHAAIMTRDLNDAATAKAKAVKIARENMPASIFGDVISDSNIHFGTYDFATKTFNVDVNSKEAVYVETGRMTDTSNAVSSFLLQFIGRGSFDVVATSVYTSNLPPCYSDGWLARGRVDGQSNNHFRDDYCLYSDTVIELNNGNTFDPGTSIITPLGTAGVTLSSSGMTQNTGIADALKDANHMSLSILEKFDVIEAQLTVQDSRFERKFITNTSWQDIQKKNKMTQADFPAGGMYTVNNCGNKVTFEGLIRDVVIKTNCKVDFANNAALESMVLINTNTDDSSVTASGLRIGKDHPGQPCKSTDAVQILLNGGFKAAANLQIYTSQILSQKDVQFAAQANGVRGASIIAKGEIDGTSNNDMSACPGSTNFAFYFPEYFLRG